MNRNYDIGVADLMTAFATLNPQTEEEKRDIARLLGFDYKPLEKKDDEAV